MKIALWEDKIPFENKEAETPNCMITYFLDTDKPLPVVVVFPGGAYARRADHEGAPIAEFFNSRGMHAVVVEYRVAPNRHPAPIADAKRAVQILRANAEKWMIDPNRVVTLGFSAGGHLAASTITLDDPDTGIADDVSKHSTMPNGAILCYPVIDMASEIAHSGSAKNLLGERYDECKEYFSLQNRVSEKTPQVFLWHTSDDSAANVKHSLIFGGKLRDFGIPFEMHIFPHGRHGLGLAPETSDVSKWADLAADWIEKNI